MEKHGLRYADFRRIDLNLLLVFDALMEERNVSKAATRLFTSQSAMSQALARLRDAMGDDMFIRSGSKMEPTARAMELAPCVRLWLEDANGFLFARKDYDLSKVKATVTIATIGGIESALLPPLMETLFKTAPGISIRTKMLQSNELLDAIDEEDIDIAIGPPDLPYKEWHCREPIYCTLLECVYSPERLNLPEKITLEVLAEQMHAALSWRASGGSMVDRFFEARGLRRNIVVTATCQLATLRLLRQFPLVSMQAPLVTSVFHEVPGIAVREVVVDELVFDVNLIWNRRDDKDPTQAYVRQILKDIFKAQRHCPTA